MAAVGASVLALTACSGDGGGAAGSPEEAVAQGLEARLQDGAAWSLSVDGDLDALAEQAGEPVPPEVEALFDEGLVRGAISPDGGFAMTLGADDGFFEMRAVEEALYLRMDLQALRELSPQSSGQVPDPEQLRAQVQQLGLPPTLQMTAEAALDGGWVGITGLTREAMQSFAEEFGGAMGGALPSGDEASEAAEDMRTLLEEEGLLDGQQLTERFLDVEGEGPTYDVTIRARELVETINAVNAELQDSLGAMAGSAPQEVPSPGEVPEEVSGFTITVEDGQATEIAGDVAAIAESAGEDPGELGEGDVTVRLALDALDDQLDVPSEATTVDFQELVQAAMGAMFSGTMGG